MARVFERPRYENQARNKLISYISCCRNRPLQIKALKALKLKDETELAALADYHWLAELACEDPEADADRMLPKDGQSLSDFMLDAEIGRLSREPRMQEPDVAARVISDFVATMDHYHTERVLTDEWALFFLINEAIRDTSHHEEHPHSKLARSAAFDLIKLQCRFQKIGPAMWDSVGSGAPFARGIGRDAAKFADWLRAAENGQYKAHPMWVKYSRIWAMQLPRLREHVRTMVDKAGRSEPHERHKFKFLEDAISDPQRFTVAFNYAGIIVCWVDSTCLILDSSAMDYFRVCMTSLRNGAISFANYRLTGCSTPINLSAQYSQALSLISSMIRPVHEARNVARHMHLAYTRWQNSTCEADARVDCGWEARDAKLKQDNEAMYPNNSNWYNWVMSLDIPERVRAEVFKLYHLLPPPDINQLGLHKEVTKKMQKPNPYKLESINRFIAFCKSYDLVRFMSKNKRIPKFETSSPNPWQDSHWAKKSLSGSLTMPPTEEWGVVRIRGEFAFDHTGDFHIFDAKDSTRVVANLSKYMDRAKSRDLSQIDQNELLAAIFRGPLLSTGESMPSWRTRVMNQNLSPDDVVIAAEAGKAENTKPGKKVRETLSACDTAREIFSEIDKCLRPLAAQTPGVSIRVDYVKHKRKFQHMAGALSNYALKMSIGSSTDLTGWSPTMPRAMFHAWQEYAIGTTECPNPRAVKQLWDLLTLFVDRRGVKESAHVPEGNIQGWPATSDTTMHAHVLVYWAYELRNRNILSRTETAYTLCLIDDAATSVVVDGTPEEAKRKAELARELLNEIYAELGFVMDDVKSFFSSIKFVYLNELYIDGAQVPHATKTMMRIDRDHARRFASIPEQVASTMGVASSAANQGADPFITYWIAAWSCYMLAYKAYPELATLSNFDQAAIALAPPGMNGLGIRPLTALFATGAQDMLSWYLEFCADIAHLGMMHTVSAIISQEPAIASATSAFRNPFGYTVADHRSAQTAVSRAFREAARSRGMAEPFCSLDLIEEDPAYKAAVKATLLAGEHEAGLLEEISANMPDAFVDETMARVDKNELIAFLLGARGIGALRRRVQHADRENLSVIVELVKMSRWSGTRAAEILCDIGSYEFAKQLRTQHHGDYRIINHTYPCPYSVWAFQGTIDLSSERALRLTTVSFLHTRLLRTIGSGDKDLYSSTLVDIGFKGFRSAGSNLTNESRISLYNPVKRKIAAGLAALRWAAANGAHHKALSQLFFHSWSGRHDDRLLSLLGKEFDGSPKRISLRHSKVNHIIFCFPNTQGSVRVDARALTRYGSAHSHMHDIMADVTILRTAGLLEAALGMRSSTGNFSYGFAIKPSGAALLDSPTTPESPVPVQTYLGITAFCDIDSPLAASAKVACTYEMMEHVAALYEIAGTRAANRLYERFIEAEEVEGAIGPAPTTTRVTVETAIVPIRVTTDSSSIVLRSEPVVPRATGFADPGQHSLPSTERITTVLAAAGSNDALRTLGQSYPDTQAVTMALAHPVAAAELSDAFYKSNIVAWIEEMEHRAALKESEFTQAKIRNLISEVHKLRGNTEVSVAIRTVLNAAGMRGFRVSDQNDDLQHTVTSYVGTATSTIQFLEAVAKSLWKLKGKTSEEYASKSLVGTTHASARVAVTRVIKAQWSYASGRREVKGRAMAQTRDTGDNLTRINYEAAFLKRNIRSLTAAGRLDDNVLWSQYADQVISSSANHLSDEIARDEYIATCAMEDLDSSAKVTNEEEFAIAVNKMAQIIPRFGGSINVPLVCSVASLVSSWAHADVEGRHTSYKPSRLHTAMVDAPEEPAAAAPPDPSQAISIPTAVALAPVEDLWEDISPGQIFEYIWSNPGVIEDGWDRGGSMFGTWMMVTETREGWDEIVKQLKSAVASIPLDTSDSFGDPVYMDGEDGGDWMS